MKMTELKPLLYSAELSTCLVNIIPNGRGYRKEQEKRHILLGMVKSIKKLDKKIEIYNKKIGGV